VGVHYSEGVAIRADLESCVVIREDGDEALTEERTGQPLSRERLIPDADTVTYVEGNIQRRVNASAAVIRRGLRLWHVRKFLAWEPGDLGVGRGAYRSASGRRRAVVDDERLQEV
jgi:hypothetical protein